jgi:hypothetical protein
MAKGVLSCLAIVALSHAASAKNNSKVVVPVYHDKYSQSVKKLEAGKTKIDYAEFRESFLESEQFKTAKSERSDLSSLRKAMHGLMNKSKHAEVIDVAKKILSVDYTDMEAHKILRQAYKILGDTANSTRHHEIEFGLLNSIIKKGDGKTCQTAWPVIQITEEYFILEMLDAKLLQQSLDNNGGLCDKMEVQIDGRNKTYFFEVSKVFKGYNK